MTIFRVEHKKNYTVINNFICKDKRLSWKAKGIWLYAFSRPDDWEFHINDLVKQSTDGMDAVRSGLRELCDFGYLERSRLRNSDGTLGKAEWVFYEMPTEMKERLPKVENPILDNPTQENPTLLSIEPLLDIEENDERNVVVLSEDKMQALKEYPFDQKVYKLCGIYTIGAIQQAIEVCRTSEYAEINAFFTSALKCKWKPKLDPTEESRQKEQQAEQVELIQAKKEMDRCRSIIHDLVNQWTGNLIEGYDFFFQDSIPYAKTPLTTNILKYEADKIIWMENVIKAKGKK